MKPKPLLEQIRSRVAARPPGPKRKTWLERLPPDAQEQIVAAKAEWKAGTIVSTARMLADDIVELCRQEGIATCSPETMRTWLSRD